MRGKIALVLFSFLNLILACSVSHGQGIKETIVLGTQELSLGMPRDAVLARLSVDFRLDRLQADDRWVVGEKGQPPEGVGQVQFKNGKLTYVSKEWRRKSKTDIESMYGAIAQLVKDGKTVCIIGADTHRSPDAEVNVAWVRCGKKSISISTGSVSQTKYEDVEEELGIR